MYELNRCEWSQVVKTTYAFDAVAVNAVNAVDAVDAVDALRLDGSVVLISLFGVVPLHLQQQLNASIKKNG